jgi:hypothetical protein
MFQTLNENPDIHMEIFTDKDSGLAWISAGKGRTRTKPPKAGEASTLAGNVLLQCASGLAAAV